MSFKRKHRKSSWKHKSKRGKKNLGLRITDGKVYPITVTRIDEPDFIELREGTSRKQLYNLYLLSNKWKRKRNKVLKRDMNKCRKCRSSKHLHVHHLTYERIFVERLSDLITLCSDCHSVAHS